MASLSDSPRRLGTTSGSLKRLSRQARQKGYRGAANQLFGAYAQTKMREGRGITSAESNIAEDKLRKRSESGLLETRRRNLYGSPMDKQDSESGFKADLAKSKLIASGDPAARERAVERGRKLGLGDEAISELIGGSSATDAPGTATTVAPGGTAAPVTPGTAPGAPAAPAAPGAPAAPAKRDPKEIDFDADNTRDKRREKELSGLADFYEKNRGRMTYKGAIDAYRKTRGEELASEGKAAIGDFTPDDIKNLQGDIANRAFDAASEAPSGPDVDAAPSMGGGKSKLAEAISIAQGKRSGAGPGGQPASNIYSPKAADEEPSYPSGADLGFTDEDMASLPKVYGSAGAKKPTSLLGAATSDVASLGRGAITRGKDFASAAVDTGEDIVKGTTFLGKKSVGLAQGAGRYASGLGGSAATKAVDTAAGAVGAAAEMIPGSTGEYVRSKGFLGAPDVETAVRRKLKKGAGASLLAPMAPSLNAFRR